MSSQAPLFPLLFTLLLIIISPSTSKSSSRPLALYLRVKKDPSSLQYITHIRQRTPFVSVKLTVDLDNRYLWIDCSQGGNGSSSYQPLNCSSLTCQLAGGFPCGFLRDNDLITCYGYSNGREGTLAENIVSVQSTNGSGPGKVVIAPRIIFSCGSRFGPPNGVEGIAGLGRSYSGLPSQLARSFHFPRKFALCLSSSTKSKGAIIFGDVPYLMIPDKNLSNSLTYTPLVLNPNGDGPPGPAAQYYIGIKSIRINGKTVPLNSTLLTIYNKQLGIGGSKISTANPYTVMESSIFKAFVKLFVNELGRLPLVKPVAPFKICYNARRFPSLRTGTRVPVIELVLQGTSTSWKIYGSNSMVAVTNDVYCLGFLDSGQTWTSVVIGGYQLEENLLQFDISKSRLGFSSSLLLQGTRCANFRFMSP